MAKLYLVGTPIGNLGDLSPRAAQVLGMVDFIAAEDTRVSMKILNHIGVKKPLISYHAHNIHEKSLQVIGRIQNGENCAIVTDAGMPCISDPGEELVALCHNMGVEIEVVPGPSAVIAGLAASGLSTRRFTFEGFLTVRRSGRMEHLTSLIAEPRTMVFYEAPHKIVDTLTDMLAVLGDRRIAVCRELTKLYEQVWQTTLSAALEHYTTSTPKGEFVLVVEGALPTEEKTVSQEDAVNMVLALANQGQPMTDAAKTVAKETKYKKSDLYRLASQAKSMGGQPK